MSKKNKKRGIPGRKLKCGLSEAGFRKVVKQYVISKMCRESFAKAKIEVLRAFYVGVVQGYEDLLNLMHVKDEEFKTVFKQLDPDSVKLEAREAVRKIMEESKKATPKLVTNLPGLQGAKVLRAAKEVFDKHLEVGRK